MAKVYVIAWDYDYDGYGEPAAAYSTREAAEAFTALHPGGHGDPIPDIFELEVDA